MTGVLSMFAIEDRQIFAASRASSLLRFDTLADSARVPAGYGRLQWQNIGTVTAARFEAQYGVTGYSTGLVSGGNVAYFFPGGGTIGSGSAADFAVQSVYVTAAWRDGMTVTIRGFDDGVERYTRTVIVNDESPLFVDLGFRNIDTLTIVGTGGTPSNPAYPNYQVVIDDLRVMTVPGAISGTVYADRNADGRRNAHDGGLADRLVYLDESGNGTRDAGERSTRTAADGRYTFANVPFGEYDVSFDPGQGRAATTDLADHYRYSFAAGDFADRYGGSLTPVTPRNALGTVELDDGWYEMTLTTPLELWGTTYFRLYISVNGLIEFDGPTPNSTNTALPDTTRGPVIAPFWADLTLANGGDLLVTEVAATGKIVVLWSNIQYYQQEEVTRSSFIVEIDRDGTIAFDYYQVGAVPPTGYPNGVTIGVEGDTGDGASPYSIGTTLPSAYSRIVFTPDIEQTGIRHVILDAGRTITGVDFGAARVSPNAFADPANAADFDMIARAPWAISPWAHDLVTMLA